MTTSVGWLLGEVCGSNKQDAAVPLTRVLMQDNKAVSFIAALAAHEMQHVTSVAPLNNTCGQLFRHWRYYQFINDIFDVRQWVIIGVMLGNSTTAARVRTNVAGMPERCAGTCQFQFKTMPHNKFRI